MFTLVQQCYLLEKYFHQTTWNLFLMANKYYLSKFKNIELKPALNNVLTIVIVYIRYLSMLITSTQSRLISFIESSSRYSKVTNK